MPTTQQRRSSGEVALAAAALAELQQGHRDIGLQTLKQLQRRGWAANLSESGEKASLAPRTAGERAPLAHAKSARPAHPLRTQNLLAAKREVPPEVAERPQSADGALRGLSSTRPN
jgi:hypothetical protein